jgi:uncharacterized protein YkwD
MLIDDGTASRSHRRNLLSTKFKKIGIAAGVHPTYGNVCVIVFAERFAEGKGGLKQF